jgi:hypothetical protein
MPVHAINLLKERAIFAYREGNFEAIINVISTDDDESSPASPP